MLFIFLIFSIVDESGASIYSVSSIAKDELPDMDHSLRGAGKYDIWMLVFPLFL